MGCNCKGTTKGIANRVNEKWIVEEVFNLYQIEIEDKTIQYFTSEQRQLVLDWYYQLYPNSIPVDYKVANRELLKAFDYHKL